MKNLLYIHRTQGNGVEAVHINGIADNCQELGYNVSFLSPAGKEKPGKAQASAKQTQEQKQSFAQWLSAHMPEFLFECVEIFYNIVAFFRGRQYESIDIIYERYAIFSVVGILLGKHFNCPVALEVNYTSLSPLVRARTSFLKPLAKRFDQWIFKRATAIIAVSGTLKAQLINDFGIDADKITVIANAADPKLFTVAEKKTAPECVIGFVGGFYPWHGLSLLVDAVKILIEREQKVKCLLIGDGPELDAIKSKVQSYNLEEFFSFPGRIPHAELTSYVAEFDIGVMPDSNDYGSPMKLFEYMAAGIPFVASDYPPIVEICHGQGLVFEKNNVDSFVEALFEYTNSFEKRSKAGTCGRNLVLEQFNWKNNAQRTIAHVEHCYAVDGENNV